MNNCSGRQYEVFGRPAGWKISHTMFLGAFQALDEARECAESWSKAKMDVVVCSVIITSERVLEMEAEA